MYKSNYSKSLFLYILYLAIFCSAFATPSLQAAESSDLQIFFSGNIQGETEPCG
jgi:hypothetical protein